MSIDALRAIQSLFPDAEVVESDATVDESHAGAYGEAPCLVSAESVEDPALRAHAVVGEPEVRFAAFLDGIQRARVRSHRRGVPIVEGTVAAAVRIRVERRFTTWGHAPPIVSRRLYMPSVFLQYEGCDDVNGFEIVDTSYDKHRDLVSRHPAALRAVAFERIGRDREATERELAEMWCSASEAPLFIDGGISGSALVAGSSCAVGVIKSHQKLYADGEGLDVVMSLRRGERSSVFAPPSPPRNPVLSWYLRLRDPRGHDALFGLVRIEASIGGDIAQRANEISRWVLAEVSPVALPDSRWDRMAYGIRDCEQFLRSIA